MVAFAWGVLVLVFLDELLATASFGLWGWQVGSPRWLLVVVLPLVAMGAWSLFASPKAPLAGGGRRDVVKVLVYALATAALWDAGHTAWAVAFLAFSVVVNGLAATPAVRDVAGSRD
jgi:hypothetical protein